ncbi:MAG: hypothetical protein V4651_02615 [Bacteroidota bacterium]
MDLRSEILREHSKPQTLRIVQYVGNDKQRMKELMVLFLGNEYRITQRAAWPLSYIGIAHPDLVKPYDGKLLEFLQQQGAHDAVKRNILRLWGETMPSQKYWGELFDICYQLARSKDEAVAIRTFAMQVMSNIVITYPELTFELKSLAEELILLGQPAFISRGKKVLKLIEKSTQKKSHKRV